MNFNGISLLIEFGLQETTCRANASRTSDFYRCVFYGEKIMRGGGGGQAPPPSLSIYLPLSSYSTLQTVYWKTLSFLFQEFAQKYQNFQSAIAHECFITE